MLEFKDFISNHASRESITTHITEVVEDFEGTIDSRWQAIYIPTCEVGLRISADIVHIIENVILIAANIIYCPSDSKYFVKDALKLTKSTAIPAEQFSLGN